MHTTNYWFRHFKENAGRQHINWLLKPVITTKETHTILSSLQAWQLGETSDGSQLTAAATRYAQHMGDPAYVDTIKLFIKEEQKHGENLGRYLDAIGQPRIKANWGDTLFRKVRHLNTSMEMWTLAVIAVESIAQVYYQALKDATDCPLLKSICTDILTDEAFHITFQTERLALIYEQKSNFSKSWRRLAYACFFHATSALVWFAHRKVLAAGGNAFASYFHKMSLKHAKTIKRATILPPFQFA